jgi:hypothetical protein
MTLNLLSIGFPVGKDCARASAMPMPSKMINKKIISKKQKDRLTIRQAYNSQKEKN